MASESRGIRCSARCISDDCILLSPGEPRMHQIHDLEFNIVKYFDGQFDPFPITKDVEEEVVNGVAQIVLSHIVRPNVPL